MSRKRNPESSVISVLDKTEMIEEDERVCYINSDSTVGRVAEAMKK